MIQQRSILDSDEPSHEPKSPIARFITSTTVGTDTPRRQRLALRLRRWIELSRSISANRLFVDGSFVTSKPEPNDVDAVVWLPENFVDLVSNGNLEAMELESMLLNRHPEEIFAAEDRRDWDDWLEFFSRTRESDGRRKGVVEITL